MNISFVVHPMRRKVHGCTRQLLGVTDLPEFSNSKVINDIPTQTEEEPHTFVKINHIDGDIARGPHSVIIVWVILVLCSSWINVESVEVTGDRRNI
mmetsp:Transcript_464/g.882  ORF Transcript_464/g.882 Transcript_464/m.882 type:complete len:96 (-) Transcript_464:414-701(-)